MKDIAIMGAGLTLIIWAIIFSAPPVVVVDDGPKEGRLEWNSDAGQRVVLVGGILQNNSERKVACRVIGTDGKQLEFSLNPGDWRPIGTVRKIICK